MKIHQIILSTSLVFTLVASGCASKSNVIEFDQKLDTRIQGDLAKRQQLVKGNPLYMQLVADLNQGRNYLLSGQSSQAFKAFDKILANTRYTNYPEYSYAKYYIANALYDMGVDYGALLYFVDIVRKEPLRTHTHESLRRAIAIAQKLKDDELILYLASSISRKKVPKSLREEFRYFLAKALYKKRQFRKATKLLKEISSKNRLYFASRYLLGAISVERRHLKTATRHFRTISDYSGSEMYYEHLRITQLANLALGRIYYEQKIYPLSIAYYKKVKRDGEFYPMALYESSWALFKLNKFNEALSVLHSLNSPFFEQVYFLKSHLLRGAILLELCLYEEAVESLTILEKRFGKLGRQIDRFAKQAKVPQDYYPILTKYEAIRAGGEPKFRFLELFKLAAANRDFLGLHRYIERLDREQETLKDLGTGRARLLQKLLAQKETELVAKASFLSGKKLLLTRQLIADFVGLKDVIRFEIVSAERKILQKRSLGLAPPVIGDQDLIKPEFTDSLRESLIWWDWNGEYWRDEVGFYLMNLQSRCKDRGESAK